jgi:pyruvate/2-oxoglutarate dehydrogenase complex dihydrolipoamide dehydrogenase (E3) component
MPQLERFEPLSLAVEMAACFWPGTWGDPGDVLPWWSAVGLAAPAPTSTGIPSKNEIWSAKVADLVRHAASFGAMTGSVTIDMGKVRQRKRDMVEDMIAMTLQQYKASGAELIMGAGNFVAPKTLDVRLNDGETRVLVGDQVFLNIGTHATIPSVPGLDAAGPLTNIEALELDYVPQHLIVLGGGYVGLEMAQAYRRFGSRATIIEHGPQLAGREDPDVADEMRRILSAEGIDILVATETRNVQGRSGGDVSLLVRTSSGEQTIEGSDILVAAGRSPNTVGIGLEVAGVELDGDQCARGLGDRRMCRQPTVHPRIFRRLPDHSGQFGRANRTVRRQSI